MESSWVILIVGSVMMSSVIVLTIILMVNWVWVKPKRIERSFFLIHQKQLQSKFRIERSLREQGLKGNPYTLLIGDYKSMGTLMNQVLTAKPMQLTNDILPRVFPFNHFLAKTYGKDTFMWLGPTPLVNMMNPEHIKIVTNKMSEFSKRHESPLVKYLLTGLLELHGQKWAKHRKIIKPAFHPQKLMLVLPALYESCNETIKEWKMMVNEKGSCELDVWPFLNNMSGEVISRTAFGNSFQQATRVFQLIKEQAQFIVKAISSIYIPGWRFVPTKMNRRMKEIDNEMQVLLREMIHQREKAMKEGEATNDDLLSLLLESNHKELEEYGNKSNMGMSTEDVIKECKLFYFAGQETTATLLNWTMVLLSRFPYWQQQAREEINQVFGSNKPDHEGLNRLKVVSMILYEVLRLYPSVPAMSRVTRKEMKLGDLRLPEGTNIMIPTIVIHQDPDLWGDDAKEFKPERFSEGVSKATKGQTIYLPFGWGPRICIGQHLALLEAKMALSLILQNFSFELSPSYAHAPFFRITIQPQFGTHIILHKL